MTAPRSLISLALVGLLAALAPAASARTSSSTGAIIDSDLAADCQEFVPESYALNGVNDSGEKISLDVYMLLDLKEGADVARLKGKRRAAAMDDLVAKAKKVLAKSPTSYEPLNIDLNFKEWGLLAPKRSERTVDSQSIIDLSKEKFGGQRPAGFDVVYTLTDLDMTAPEVGAAVAGQADCIGGVRYDEHAFAVGEISQYEDLAAGPITFYHAATAKIASHEIGHLMGAHHHYQDCVEGIPTELENGEVSPCTLMTNAVDFQSLNFSVLEGAVVRGHAQDFAAANDR